LGGSILQKRRLGNTDLLVSVLGLGTVKFGRNQGLKYPQPFDLPTDKEIKHLLALAHEQGINLLDTAPAYGSSEERLGKLLVGARDQWIIATKVGEAFDNGVSTFDFSKNAVLKSIDRSLRRLNTDYLDIVLVHSNGEDEKIIQQYDIFTVLAGLKQSGKIRSFGMSSKTIIGGRLSVDLADMAMVTYHPGYTEEKQIIDYASTKQKGILIKKAFASGHFQKMGVDPVEQALQMCLRETAVSSVIVGTINPHHLLENVQRIDRCAPFIPENKTFSDTP
jgi:aryl-alcohol dehydrogenase-like predicted oxidoreductase